MISNSPNKPVAALPEIGPEYSAAAAAAYLGIANATLAIWRCTNRYPLPYIKVGRRVRYRKEDLDAFLASRTVGGNLK